MEKQKNITIKILTDTEIQNNTPKPLSKIGKYFYLLID